MSLINNKGVDLLARMLEQETLGENVLPFLQDRVRNSIAVLLSAMLEGNDDR
eukprot:CAMPEP_0181251396 /NCGR_PEP_ID=MMETSP1096-20121128/46862_1 /TAXON_ID=156174 ORGANISM="Chrysochromulina ericina, Strain CCMP281" /NCGR_SAMPLE_ID=MMETSP1096 /ASSEMBLY_ACC=CAM_ASM_000453 /LENGTH=51 /DNA_ID=CAMNT_0023348991 /DNA_START=29 /DNA_END=181 /DNA_ORIENTATION=-